jgi:hypothetical protein
MQQMAEQDDEMQQRYAEYIMNRPDSSRPTGNGDMLIQAMEDGYLWDDFLEWVNAMEKEYGNV